MVLWREYFPREGQRALLAEVLAGVEAAPFYKPVMPKSGKPFSVEETNFGPLGWISDRDGYRYAPLYPYTEKPWPDIRPRCLRCGMRSRITPRRRNAAWSISIADPRRWARTRNRDEQATEAPVVSVSLGDDALFRFGGTTRKGPTQSITLSSGDVLVFGGPARLMFHGIDRVVGGSSGSSPWRAPKPDAETDNQLLRWSRGLTQTASHFGGPRSG
ncbi:MAG: alpha-ketoglutarate-dependent dioxygenase AlkB [Rhizomicrobium sp.]